MIPVYLIRHAKAKSRAKWSEPDHLRPLSGRGRRQAAALPSLFERQSFSRLVTSPYVRCVQTLEPLAQARGLPIEKAASLAEGATSAAALELMVSLAALEPTVCCTHADVVLEVVRTLAGAGVPLAGPLEAEVAGTWVLDLGEGAFVSGRYLAPPE